MENYKYILLSKIDHITEEVPGAFQETVKLVTLRRTYSG